MGVDYHCVDGDVIVLLPVPSESVGESGNPLNDKILESELVVEETVGMLLHGLSRQSGNGALSVIFLLRDTDLLNKVLELIEGDHSPLGRSNYLVKSLPVHENGAIQRLVLASVRNHLGSLASGLGELSLGLGDLSTCLRVF